MVGSQLHTHHRLGATVSRCASLTLPKEVGDRKILLPSARHLEEGRGTTIPELLRLENCIMAGCAPDPLEAPPPTPSVKMAKSSLARAIWGGGGLGVPGVGTRDPRHGLGGPYTRKNFFRTQFQIHTQ